MTERHTAVSVRRSLHMSPWTIPGPAGWWDTSQEMCRAVSVQEWYVPLFSPRGVSQYYPQGPAVPCVLRSWECSTNRNWQRWFPRRQCPVQWAFSRPWTFCHTYWRYWSVTCLVSLVSTNQKWLFWSNLSPLSPPCYRYKLVSEKPRG